MDTITAYLSSGPAGRMRQVLDAQHEADTHRWSRGIMDGPDVALAEAERLLGVTEPACGEHGQLGPWAIYLGGCGHVICDDADSPECWEDGGNLLAEAIERALPAFDALAFGACNLALDADDLDYNTAAPR